jgi:hypothetical protein
MRSLQSRDAGTGRWARELGMGSRVRGNDDTN